MKAAIFDRFGAPDEVLQIRDIPVPDVGRGEVRVGMIAAPLNPSDLLVVRGEYGRLPRLPATPGFEGVGVVETVGPGVLRHIRQIRIGQRVAVLNGRGGTWQEFVSLPIRQIVPLPDNLSDEQGASFFVNPATALAMIRYVFNVPPGSWLLQTAAGSALGRMVIRLGQTMGFRTVNIVRRPEQVDELLRAGATAVFCSETESLEERVKALTGGQGVAFALDAVGGDTGTAAARCLGYNGRLLCYGTLSGRSLVVDPRSIIVGQHRIEGFWLSNWVKQQGILTMVKLFRQIKDLIGSGILSSQVESSFPLEEIRNAVQLAEGPGRNGKVLLNLKKGR